MSMNRGPSYLDTYLTKGINSMGGGLSSAVLTKTIDWGDHVTVTYDANTRTIRLENIDGGLDRSGRISGVWFVDGGTTATVHDGGLRAPFASIQAAIDTIAALDPMPSQATILVAPGSYAESLVLPAIRPSVVTFEAIASGKVYLPTPTGGHGGSLVVNEATTGSSLQVEFVGVLFSASTAEARYSIASDSPTTKKLTLRFRDCSGPVNVECSSLSLDLRKSLLSGSRFVGHTATSLYIDGFSWFDLAPTLNISPSNYNRTFWDVAVDTCDGTLDATVAVNANLVVGIDHPGTRAGEFASVTLLDATPATDFTLTFHHTSADQVFFTLHNLSRQSGVFGDNVRTCAMHGALPTVVVPPS